MDDTDKRRTVQQMQDFIEANLCQPITLADLARASGYSPGHCARVFREITGYSPFDYIRSYRLSRAALRLQARDNRVLDVALDFVFGSHEGFTRAFSRHFGVPPRDYVKKGRPDRLFLPVRIQNTQARVKGDQPMDQEQNRKNLVFIQVVERPERDFILRRGIKADEYFAYCEEVGCDVWSILCAVPDALYEPIGAWLPEHLVSEGTSTYVQGVEVPTTYSGEVPEGYDRIRLPACKMMVFQGPPFKDEDFEEAIVSLNEIMESYDPALYGFRWADDDGPFFQMEPQGYRGYIAARPVRQL